MPVSKQHPNKAPGETPQFSQILFQIFRPFFSTSKADLQSTGTRGGLEAHSAKCRLMVLHGQEGQGMHASARERPGSPLEKGLPPGSRSALSCTPMHHTDRQHGQFARDIARFSNESPPTQEILHSQATWALW